MYNYETRFPEYSQDEILEWGLESVFEIECPNCGEFYRIEPDAKFKCHNCKENIMSPLVYLGLI